MNNFINWLYRNTNKIIYYLFWAFFFFLVVYKMLDYENNAYLAYAFWFLLGLYIGSFVSKKTSDFIKKNHGYRDESQLN